ncbi:hypothetical protein [Absidia glauca]|uniref:Protein kinase domain-containing protein n=1 Tax=Absidia glauca TaxID=4829 RepID=A0A168RLV0_ABSGL|nr:hypothetical protein [Absidia glauca]
MKGVKSLKSASDMDLNCLDDSSSLKDEMENLSLAPDGLLRLREHTTTSDQATISPTILRSDSDNNTDATLLREQAAGTLPLDRPISPTPSPTSTLSTPSFDIAKFPQDSLHSFRFSSATSTDLVALRKRVMTRSIDFIKHSTQGGWKAPETLPGHYSTTNLLASMDRKRNKARSMGYTQPTQAYDTDHIPTSASGSSISIPPATKSSSSIHQRRTRRSSLPDINEDSHNNASTSTRTLSSSSSVSTSTTDSSSRTSSTRATTPAGNTSISKLTSSSNDEGSNGHGPFNEDDDELDHQQPSLALFPHPALHNPTRFLPQNQAILTTYDDWKVILSNNIASFVLVGGGGGGGINGHRRFCSSLVGKSVLDYVDESFRGRLQAMIKKRRQELVHLEDSAGGMVLVCGNVLPIVKDDGTKSAASLWLKEKRNDAGSSVYIWIFEEVFETVTHVSIDSKGLICYADNGIEGLLDYAPESLMGKSIDTLIPSLSMDQHANTSPSWQDINRYKYFGCRTRLGAHLPIIIKLLDKSTTERPPNCCSTIRITSIPMIAGLVTIRQDGIIEGCNDVFVKYMFGYSQEELVTGQKSIGDLMPQFPGVLQSLRRDDLLQHGVIINNIICRKLVADLTTPSTTPAAPTPPQGGKRLTQTPNGQPLPVLIAVHRDGTEFEIQLQLKLAEESDDGICALWITFDRDSTLSRVGHKMGGPALELKQHNGLGLPTAKRDERIIDEEDEEDDDDDDDDDNRPTSLASSVSDTDCQNDPSSIHTNRTLEYTKETQPRQYQHHTDKTEPMIIPLKTAGYSSSPSTHDSSGMGGSLSVSRPPCDTGSPRVTSFSRPTFSTYTQQEDQPSPTSPSTPYSPTAFGGNRPRAFSTASVTMPEYSAQTHSLCIDDFEILDEIGQGAYGLVKLAVQKKDMSQKKVVIKYVIKSRILVDCWTRDRKLGMVPAEIHILHTLRKIPHDNCGDMMDYFEDDDYYYIVMELHGAGMDLFDYIEFKDTMHESEIRSIFKQIAMAVRHLHSHKIVHRDIKDENVVLDHNGGIRLIDFGSAAYIRPGRRYETFVGTLDYAAPEILRGQTYDGPPQDVWALGILLALCGSDQENAGPRRR